MGVDKGGLEGHPGTDFCWPKVLLRLHFSDSRLADLAKTTSYPFSIKATMASIDCTWDSSIYSDTRCNVRSSFLYVRSVSESALEFQYGRGCSMQQFPTLRTAHGFSVVRGSYDRFWGATVLLSRRQTLRRPYLAETSIDLMKYHHLS